MKQQRLLMKIKALMQVNRKMKRQRPNHKSHMVQKQK